MKNGTQIRKTAKNKQTVLPENYHEIVFTEFPGNMDYLGSEKVSELTKQRFYWPYTAKNINFYVAKDADLLKCDWNGNEVAPLASIESWYPFVMVSDSLLRLNRCKCCFEYILKKFTQSYASRNKSAKTAASKPFNNFMLQFSFSTRNHHDRGAEFRNHLSNYLHTLQ